MTAHVQIGGTWVDVQFPSAELKHTTCWRVDKPSGDLKASVALRCPKGLQAPWTQPEQPFLIGSPSGGRLWGGITIEPERSMGEIQVNAVGVADLLAYYDAIANAAGPTDPPDWQPTFVPNTAVDERVSDPAFTLRMDVPFDRYGNDLGDDELGPGDKDPQIIDIGTLLARGAVAQGKRVHVDSWGRISYQADPVVPSFTTTPISDYMGTADDSFVTRLWGYVDPTTVVMAEDLVAEEKFGVRERPIDLSALGSESAAQDYIDGRLALVGGRMGWTTPIDLTGLNLMHIGGAWANPRHVKAGTMLQIPGVVDARSNPVTRGAIWIVLSEVEVTEATRPTAVASPPGFAPRDFEGALAPPDNDALKETA